MPTFIWKAKDRYGQEVAQRINAESAQSARDILLSEGYTDLRLQQDELMDTARKQSEAASSPEYVPELTAQQEVEKLEGKVPTVWSNWWRDIKKSSLMIVVWVVLLFWGIYWEKTWLLTFSALMLFWSFFLFPIICYWFGMTSRLYQQLLQAKVWHRWPEVYALSYRLEKAQKITQISIGPCETARARSQALAGMGRLPEAIKEFEAFSDPSKLEPAFYYTHLASFYDLARDFDTALSYKIKAAEAMPQNMTFPLEVALHYLLRNEDLARGREALAKVDESLVVETARPFLEFTHGLMFLVEQKPALAQAKFKATLDRIQPYLHNVMVFWIINITKSYMALTHTLVGERAEAVILWQEVKPYLEAVKEKELADKIRAALGVPA